MTTETLLPFDPEIAERHPERVRLIEPKGDQRPATARAVRVNGLGRWIAVFWQGMDYRPHVYSCEEAGKLLRLAPPEPKKMKVRAYRDLDGYIYFSSHVYANRPSGQRWASDPVEIPLYPQEDA